MVPISRTLKALTSLERRLVEQGRQNGSNASLSIQDAIELARHLAEVARFVELKCQDNDVGFVDI